MQGTIRIHGRHIRVPLSGFPILKAVKFSTFSETYPETEGVRMPSELTGSVSYTHLEADAAKSSGRFSVMRPVREGDVQASTLNPRIDSARERNIGFLTAAGVLPPNEAPTIRACVAQTQVCLLYTSRCV